MDDLDFIPCRDTWSYISQAVPLKQAFRFTPQADLVCGGHLGYLEQGVVVFRRIVWLRETRAAVVFDEFFSDGKKAHEFSQTFHFGEGSAELRSASVFWSGKNARAALHCLGDVACELFRAPYSTDYNSLKEGDALLVKCRGEKFTSMVTVLDLAADSPLCAELIPVTRTDGEPLTVPAQAVRTVRDGTETVVLERHGDMPTPVGLLQAGRFSGHGRTIVFSDAQPDGIVLDW